MNAFKKSLALVTATLKAEREKIFDFAPLNFQSELTEIEMDLVLLHRQFQIPSVF